MKLKRLLLPIVILASPHIANAQGPQPLSVAKTISISKFGAKGDGTTDDTKSFLAAIAATANAGERLQLGDRTYLLTGTLTIPKANNPISITGGQHTKLLFAPDHPLDSGILIANDSGVELKSFMIHGSGAGLNHAISVMGSTNIRLDHLQIESIHGTGVLALAAIILGTDDRVWITNSTFTDVGAGHGKPAAAIWNYFRQRSQHIYIDHDDFSNGTTNAAIAMFDTDHDQITHNRIDGGNNCLQPCVNNGYGVLFYRTFIPNQSPTLVDETIADNRITNTAGSGIYLQGVAGAKIANNTITDTTIQMDDGSLPAAAIALNSADNIQIIDNIIRQCGKGGIALATTNDVVIEGNLIQSAANWGIQLRVRQVRTTIRKNTIDSAPIGILMDRGPSETILENNTQTNVNQPQKFISTMH
jgi:parallel beta-helix repeat protein